MKKDLQEGLRPYLPDRSLEIVMEWLRGRRILMRIARGRRTKLGDYRPPLKDDVHRISVNGDLNPFEFLLTLTHEIAHLLIWEKYGRKYKPHGIAWKKQFASMLGLLIEENIFPGESTLRSGNRSIIQGRTASAILNWPGRFIPITRSRKGFFWKICPWGPSSAFPTAGKFQKEEKLRKWYRCMSQDNHKSYRISPVAKVFPIRISRIFLYL